MQNGRARFVVCGETLIDLVQADGGAQDSFSSSWLALSAGGPMNSAVALGRLGAPTHFLGRLSTDAFGAQLRKHIEKAGVSLNLATESSQATSIAVVSLDAEGAASYTFHFAETANFGWQADDLPSLDPDDWLHIASLACVVDPGSAILLDWAGDLRCGISYDINVRPSVITDPDVYWEKVKPWLRVVAKNSGILKASDVDVGFLAGAAGVPEDPIDAMAAWVEQYGYRVGVVTLGAEGAAAVEADGSRTVAKSFPTQVVDTVGAGDTFMAGFLDAYVGLQSSVQAALTRGVAAASIVCSRRGAQPPTGTEVDDLVETRV
jgi:fructokinase